MVSPRDRRLGCSGLGAGQGGRFSGLASSSRAATPRWTRIQTGSDVWRLNRVCRERWLDPTKRSDQERRSRPRWTGIRIGSDGSSTDVVWIGFAENGDRIQRSKAFETVFPWVVGWEDLPLSRYRGLWQCRKPRNPLNHLWTWVNVVLAKTDWFTDVSLLILDRHFLISSTDEVYYSNLIWRVVVTS